MLAASKHPTLRSLPTRTRTHSQSRSFIFLPFFFHLRSYPQRSHSHSDPEKLWGKVAAQWEYVAKQQQQGRSWVKVHSSVEEYDIDLITLRKVPRNRDGVVLEAEAKVEGGGGGGAKKEKEEKERKEKEKAEKEKAEKEKAEKERKEKEKAEKEKAEKERKEKEKAEKEKREKEKAEKERREREKAEKERRERERAEKEKAEKEKKEKEKAEKEKKEREKAEKERQEREKAEKEKKEKEKAEKEKKERERAEKERAEKEKAEKEKAEKEKKEKEKKEKEEKEKEKAKEKEENDKGKESKTSSKDTTPIDLLVKSTKSTTSEILTKIIKDQTQVLKKMAPPTLPEKPTSRKEIITPGPKAAAAEVAKPKSQQPTSVAPDTKVADVAKVTEKIPPPPPASIKTEKVTAAPATGSVPAAGVPKSERAVKSPQAGENTPKPQKLSTVKDSKGGQESPDADIDLLLPSDVRKAAGIPPKPKTKSEPMTGPDDAKAKQTSANAPASPEKPRKALGELRSRMQRIAATINLGPIENFIHPKDNHHDRAHDYEWSGTENVSTEDVIKPSSAAPNPTPDPIPVPPPPSTEPAPLIEPVVPTLPFTEPPTLPPSASTTTTPQPPQPSPPSPYTYYVLIRNPDSGAMHFTPLPSTLISDFPTLSRESTAFDAMHQLDAPESFFPLWRVLQKGGFEVVAGERECLVVKVEKEGARAKVEGVLAEMRGLMSPAEKMAREVWERRRREREAESEEKEKVEEEVAEEAEEEVVGKRRPGRKIFWGAVWVAGCTAAVTAGLENYMSV